MKVQENTEDNSNTEEEKIIETEPVKKPRKVGRPLTSTWRYAPDGSYYGGPIDKEYFRKYWNEKRAIPVNCIYCNNILNKGHLLHHIKTNKRCNKIQAARAAAEATVEEA